jgi:hypothetical protein
MATTDITVKDSPLENALDVYYSFVRRLAKNENEFESAQKLLMNSTIVPFDIFTNTPFYNEGLFRNFVDRVFLGSPQGVGLANRADRFSKHYGTLISQAASRIERKYPAIADELRAIRAEMSVKTTELTDKIIEIQTGWKKIGVPETDPQYELKYLSYLEQVKYADQVGSLSDEIGDLVGQLDSVRRKLYTADEQLILDALSYLTKTAMIARPRRPTFERTVKGVNELTFADPTVRIDAICDVAPGVYPLGTLDKFMTTRGYREISIKKSSTSEYKHDSEWKAGGSARFLFWNVGGSGGGESHYYSLLKTTNEIKIEFENVAEYLVDRDLWFNPVIFEKPDLLKIFKEIGGLDRMAYVSASMIVARGLKLTLTFDDSATTEHWTKSAINGSGGVSFLGFSFGGSAGRSEYEYKLNLSTDRRTVTFEDDKLCSRVLGYRVEPFAKPKQSRFAGEKMARLLEQFKAGKLSYVELMKAKFE